MFNILVPLAVQTPTGTPNPSDSSPIDFSNPFEIIVFVIAPILLVIFYLYYRKKKKNDRE
ncbi:hypothetical protein [Gelidibacter mesophilus]|uniref:hypothetical protein n=1 Tax=Gelidibacter mesophilus TaxID=169050 RepID=UPI000488100B|nr:hypothetical protein [Gelidibacter mesophilus]